MFKRIDRKLITLLASVSYPFLMHYWVLTEQYLQAGIFIVVVVSFLVVKNLYQGHKWLALILCLVTLSIAASLWFDNKIIIFLPPIIIPLMLAYFFGKSLIGNQPAFITVLAQKLRNTPLEEKEINYTRKITFLWVVFFILTVFEDIYLAYFTDIMTWSYVTNFLNYILIIFLFVIEYAVRRIVLHDLEHPGFFSFIRKMIYVQR